MENKTILYLLVISFFGLSFSCEEDSPVENFEQIGIVEINYGKSFGECQGYCIYDLKMTSESANYVSYGWTDDLSYPDINCTTTTHDWDMLSGSINLTTFLALDETIGCPDCADGGAEWIEVVHDQGRYKVTFEYLNEPSDLAPAASAYRALMESVAQCEK